MATYEYRCLKCNRRFEKAMSLAEHGKRFRPACPGCGSRKVEQVPSGFQAVTGKKT